MCIDTQIKRVFFPTVKVLRFNRKKPLPDAEDIDYVNSYINHGVSGSVSVTGYRSVIKVENDIQKTTHVILFHCFRCETWTRDLFVSIPNQAPEH